MLDNYNFKDAQFDVKSLIHLFNLQGKDLIGLELGVLRAESFCSILQNCPNVKTLYGVDSWKPYTDILGEPYSMTEQQQEMHKFTAQHLIKYSGLKELLNIELMKNYNNAIVDECIKYQPNIDTIVDYGAGIGTLSLIFRDKYHKSPLCIEIDSLNIKYLKKRNFKFFKGHTA